MLSLLARGRMSSKVKTHAEVSRDTSHTWVLSAFRRGALPAWAGPNPDPGQGRAEFF